MDIIAYNGKYFLGAIEFYDSNKNIGFIASNHCGMPQHFAYNQDFYVDSDSFAEEEAKAHLKYLLNSPCFVIALNTPHPP